MCYKKAVLKNFKVFTEKHLCCNYINMNTYFEENLPMDAFGGRSELYSYNNHTTYNNHWVYTQEMLPKILLQANIFINWVILIQLIKKFNFS